MSSTSADVYSDGLYSFVFLVLFLHPPPLRLLRVFHQLHHYPGRRPVICHQPPPLHVSCRGAVAPALPATTALFGEVLRLSWPLRFLLNALLTINDQHASDYLYELKAFVISILSIIHHKG